MEEKRGRNGWGISGEILLLEEVAMLRFLTGAMSHFDGCEDYGEGVTLLFQSPEPSWLFQ